MEDKLELGNIYLGKSVLTQFKESMAEKYCFWMQDQEIQTATSTEALSLEQVKNLMVVWSQPGVYTFIICDKQRFSEGKEEKSMIGDVNLFLQDCSGEINLMIAEKDFRLKGIAEEVVRCLIEVSKNRLGLDKLVAKINEKNRASIRLFTKLGFRLVGQIEEFEELHFELDLKLVSTFSYAGWVLGGWMIEGLRFRL